MGSCLKAYLLVSQIAQVIDDAVKKARGEAAAPAPVTAVTAAAPKPV